LTAAICAFEQRPAGVVEGAALGPKDERPFGPVDQRHPQVRLELLDGLARGRLRDMIELRAA